MSVTLDDLAAICKYAKARGLEGFVEPLNKAMEEFEINTPKREAAFIAQIAHETAEFKYLRELASGEAYEGRADLGNTEPGDGVRFRGRGLLQITGRSNYASCAAALGLDLLAHPELLESYEHAARSSAWWWRQHGLNDLAERGNFKTITKIINGGMNGYPSRLMYWERAKAVL